ncbi:DUF805 domain-containing protein [Variovorax sp. J22R133]|uniref:DUF805 domain-containing protein n=1 Tax=Variovorax brevis TaxID=3053503 RepID=UPI002577930E|nr:DUF805 domain-containing protein [Variovorax sp. J22R133]MDM0114475.1 DUF805 domain-containing protein [Variovorax sp. J22R133]
MNYLQAVQTCLRKYVDFSGRASRPEFWWFALFQFIVLVIASFLGKAIYTIVALALVLPSLAVGARRLHDIGKSGWFLLINLVPVIGILVLIYFWVQPAQAEGNAFGALPP